MDDNLIERIWQDAGEEKEMSHEELAGVLRPRVERSSRMLHRYLWTYLLVQMVTMVLAAANFAGYSSNPVMLGVEIAICALALAFAAYGIRLYGQVHGLERLDDSLAQAVRRRLDFYHGGYSVWLWITAVSLAMLSFTINTLVDNVDGHYPINHPVVFVGTLVGMVLFVVLAFHVAHAPYVQELRAVLADLEAQILDRTLAVDQGRARWRAWHVALVVLLTAFLALGIWMAIGMGG
ncbi:MAG: hypothetical protein ACYTGW_19315 [Planctomycetota bacterium]|jgi:hypothetical protein